MKKMLSHLIVTCLFMYVIWVFGITEKSFIDKFQYMFWGTGGGLFTMFLYWLIFGSIGIATGGTAFGIGLVWQLLIGMFCGTGVGSFILVLKNPNYFEFHWGVIIPLTMACCIANHFIRRD